MATTTTFEECDKIYATLNKTFHSGVTLPLSYRRKQIQQIARLVQENTDAFYNAIHQDFHKPKMEVALAEFAPVIVACTYTLNNLEEWVKPYEPKKDPSRETYDIKIHKVPRGVVIMISPFNYPFVITLIPLIGAIAAGCTVLIKPSELSPACSKLMADLIPKYLDPNAYAVVLGGVSESKHLLTHLWDYIFFTGGNKAGALVAEAAAKHVTPHTLELGGKNPVVVDYSADINLTAKRILFGKKHNSGQLCVSPDYVLVPRQLQDKLVEAFKATYASFYPEGSLKSDDTAYIINKLHYDRIMNLIARTKGKIVTGGSGDGHSKIDLTIVRDVLLDDSLMEDEIFGPILSIVPVDSIDEAITIISKRPSPLVVYLFTDDPQLKSKFVYATRSGSLILNDTTQQVNMYEAPFGGFGGSGHGAYMGKYSFDTFTFNRTLMDVPAAAESAMAVRYPPYTEENFNIIQGIILGPIP